MNSSPLQMWPFGKKARERRRLNRAYKDFDKNTEVIENSDGKNITVDKSTIEKAKATDLENLRNKSDAELEAMRNR